MKTITVELMDCTNVLLREIAMPEMKRNDIATTYAMAMASGDNTDWKAVNNAIMERWSLSALTYIKERAWKIRSGEIVVEVN